VSVIVQFGVLLTVDWNWRAWQ